MRQQCEDAGERSRGNSKCKGPGVGKSLACLRKRKEASVACEQQRALGHPMGGAGSESQQVYPLGGLSHT